MPPILDALQAVFPDILQQPLSASDEAADTVGDTEQTPSSDVTQAYSGRISAINTKVRFKQILHLSFGQLKPDQLTLAPPVQFSVAIDNTTQQQRYLDAQQQQAKQADEEALAQADIGAQTIHQLTNSLRTSSSLPHVYLLCRLYPRLAPSWPSSEALTLSAGSSAGAVWRCGLDVSPVSFKA